MMKKNFDTFNLILIHFNILKELYQKYSFTGNQYREDLLDLTISDYTQNMVKDTSIFVNFSHFPGILPGSKKERKN